jgi:hypothetical protein
MQNTLGSQDSPVDNRLWSLDSLVYYSPLYTKKSTPWCIHDREVETPWFSHHRGGETPQCIHYRGVETRRCIHHQGVVLDTEESF